MSVGEIKSVLTLDATKFTAAIERATGNLSTLDKGLKGASEVAGTFEKSISGLSADLTSTSGKFKQLEQSLSGLTARMEQVANTGFDALSSKTRRAKSDTDAATKSTEKLGAGIMKMSDWISQYGTKLDALKPSLQNVTSSQEALTKAQNQGAASASKSASEQISAKIKALEVEQATNARLIDSKLKTAKELRAIEQRMANDASAMRFDADLRYFGKNKNGPKALAVNAEIDRLTGNAAVAGAGASSNQAAIAAIREKNTAIGQTIALLRDEAAQIKVLAGEQKSALRQQRLDAVEAAKERRRADQESIASAREVAKERARAAADAARAEREQAQDIARMWKGMAQMYAGAKIGQGLSAGIGKASELQQAEMRVKLLNLPTAEMEEFKKKAFDITKEEKYLSTIEAVQARLDALTAIGANHTEVIDATLQSALRNAQVMMSAGYEHGSRSDLVKNLYGFAESRQVMNDPEKVKESFDISRRMGVASGGKINIGDLETVARSMGDLRQTMSKEGWMGVASLMEQFKVAGSQGGAGGAGAGVSTVGTILKMMSLYAAGKPVTNIAATQLLGAGVLNDNVPQSAGGKEATGVFNRSMKTAGFKGAADMQANPVAFFSGLREQLLNYMKGDKQKGKFFEGNDTESESAEATALKRFFAKMGMSNKTVEGMLVMTNKAFIERSANVVKLAEGAADEEQSVNAMKDTWKNAVTEMQAGADKLGAAFSPLLTPLAEIPKALGGILTAAADFVRDNPLAAAWDAAGVAAGGLVLSINGMLSMFSAGGGLMSAIATPFTKLGTLLVAGELGFVSFLTRLFSAAGWVALAGQIGWVVGTWVKDWDIGGLKLVEHLQNKFLDIGSAFANMLFDIQEKWISFLKLIGGGDYQKEAADRAELAAERKKRGAYEEDMRIVPDNRDSKGSSKSLSNHMNASGMSEKDLAAATKANEAGGKPPITGRDIAGAPDKAPRAPRNFEDAFARQFSAADAKANIEKLKLDSMMSGDASFAEQAHQQVIKMWMGGDLDDGKGPDKRKFVKGAKYDKDGVATINGKKYDPKVGYGADQMDWDAKVSIGGDEKRTLTDLEKRLAKELELAAVLKATTFAKGRSKALDNEAGDAIGELTGKTAGQTDAMKALIREFERLEGSTPGIEGNAAYVAEKAKALTSKATIDYANEAIGLKQKNKDIGASLLPTERERLVASQDALIESETKKLNVAKEALNERIAAMVKAGETESEEYTKTIAAREAGESEHTMFLENLQKRREDALLSPIQKMAKEWKDVHKQMESAESQWASGFVTTLETALDTGKLDFGAFAASILKDIRKIYIQDTLATPLANGMKKIGDIAMSSLFDKSGGAKEGDSTAATGLSGVFNGVTNSVKAFWNSLTGATDATSKSITQGASEMLGISLKMTAEQTATASLMALASAASAASVSMGGSVGGLGGMLGGLFGGGGDIAAGAQSSGAFTSAVSTSSAVGVDLPAIFANGGIMTDYGAVSLRKYANGGIARSPQLALYGEAGPEAYVPLPDGRSIPVTMTGGQGGNVSQGGDTVTIQINVTASGDSGDKKSGEDEGGVWVKLADRVKAVVRDELIVNQRPGGLLYK